MVKRMIVFLGLIALVTFSTMAVSEDRGSEVVAELSKELDLTDSQIESVIEIMDNNFSEMEVIMSSEDSRFKKIRSLRSQKNNKNEAMEEVLNDEQYEKYIALMKEKREEFKASRKKQK